MKRPRHLGRWIVAGSTCAAFIAVATVMGTAGAAPVRKPAVRPIHQLNFARGTSTPSLIPDSYIVLFKNTVAATSTAVNATATSLAARYGGTVRQTYSHAVHGYSAHMTAAQARSLAASDQVASVQQDSRVRISGTEPNPPSWGLDRIDQAVLPDNHSYTYPTTASNVHAYVIDTGIRISHAEFGGRASYGFDFVDNDSVADDCAGHGTHVAGTIGGDTYGVAKGVNLVAVRVLDCAGSGSASGVIAGIDWVTANAVKPAVANMSLGGASNTLISTAVRNSIAAGITYTVAAGNEGIDACTRSPSDVTEAIVTGASDVSDFRAPFSNTGSCVAVFAPGTDIVSAWFEDDTSASAGQWN